MGGDRGAYVGIVIACVAAVASCGEGSPTSPDSSFVSVQTNVAVVTFDFNLGMQGWVGEYAPRYWRPGGGASSAATFESRLLVAPLDTTQRGFYLAGDTDGGMLLAKRRVSGLPASRDYAARFTIEMATNAPAGCNNIDGRVPDVEAYANATAAEPAAVTDSSGILRPEWTAPGSVFVGNVTTGAGCARSVLRVWAIKTLAGGAGSVKTDASGRLWLSFVAREYGGWNGFSSGSPFYLIRYVVDLTPQ